MGKRELNAPFSREALTSAEADSGGNRETTGPVTLNATANQVAHQYRRDTISPVMVSGLMRIAEFCLVFFSGFTIFMAYVGFHAYLSYIYPLSILSGALVYVLLI